MLVDVITCVNEREKGARTNSHKFDYTECCYAGSLPRSSYTTRATPTSKCEGVFDGATSRCCHLAYER